MGFNSAFKGLNRNHSEHCWRRCSWIPLPSLKLSFFCTVLKCLSCV